jgi:2-oxoglutarate ferredoxin oxidoreductase subunit gamma
MRQEFVAAGFGGQGIILMGITACVAAGIYDDKMVAQTQSYGPVSRGGACRTDVVISNEPIDYGKALSPDIMVLMSEQARDRYLAETRPDESIVIIDSTLIKEMPPEIKNVYRVPATELAEVKLGERMIANMIMLGAAAAITNFITVDALRAAVKETVREKHVSINLKGIEEGYNYGMKLIA